MTMTHPGLPATWAAVVLTIVGLLSMWALLAPAPQPRRGGILSLARLPGVGGAISRMVTTPWVLLSLKLVMVGLFLLVIYAGLFGTPIPERNIATVLTWTIWWSGVIISIFFLGSAWCAVCPWDTLAQWLVRRRFRGRAEPNNSLNLRLPRALQNVWPALVMFIGLTWLELGVGITLDPYVTALLALLMVVMATVSLAVFGRKAFCRNICPVGRTIGFYSQLAAIELRPIDQAICASCETLECYHGNADVEPCPTSLVMGRLTQNSYCTSCGNCTQSCPHQNISWQLRPPSVEAVYGARPRWDEAWFMLTLLALTAFHGLMMLPSWETWMSGMARLIGDSGKMLWTFTIGLLGVQLIVTAIYAGLVSLTRRFMNVDLSFRRFFSTFAFVALPLAFTYHVAHNLNHLLGESGSIGAVFANPLGVDALPLSMAEMHARQMLIAPEILATVQAALLIMGFVIAVQVVRLRGFGLLVSADARAARRGSWRLSPLLIFAGGMTLFHLWMLMQPMIMRM
ncbi:MAG: 4Fe-4S binding protein [Proteobacteria bacterium]|nr:4Fe-4S binding protein [Pseudomonadota bacterium]